MRWPALLLSFLLLSLGATAPAAAQSQECELLPGAKEAVRSVMGGVELIHISGPATFVCPGDVLLKADSAVGNREAGEIELIGSVFYQDSVKTLDAGWARYLREEARLFAREDVVLTDRQNHSVIKGDELEYLPANEEREEAEAIVLGRPRALFYDGDPAALPPDSVAEPLEVDADIMRLYGYSRFVALGRVELTRGDTRGYSHEGEFDQEGELIILSGEARLEGESFKLSGDRIEATLEDEKLREVISRRDAILEGEEMDLRAAEVRIYFVEGEVDRLVAVGGGGGEEGAEGAESPPSDSIARPLMISREIQLVADSIDALLPGQQLEVLVAIGDAFAVRASDSLDHGLPETISNDWLVGDTITSYFVPAPEEETEASPDARSSTADGSGKGSGKESQRVILDRLVAVGEGGRARALYRIREKGRETEPPGVNYLIANRIVLVMDEGEVKDVEADGPIEGIHLQPEGVAADAPQPEPAETVAAPVGSQGGQPN